MITKNLVLFKYITFAAERFMLQYSTIHFSKDCKTYCNIRQQSNRLLHKSLFSEYMKPLSLFRLILLAIICSYTFSDVRSCPTDSICIDSLNIKTDSSHIIIGDVCTRNVFDSDNIKTKKNFKIAALETFGMNISLWAYDRYIQKGQFAYISLNTIIANFKNGFEWDNDHLNTNMFAHPYNGSLFFNAGRSNGFNFWQSELFAISGSTMWELFMEREYPSTNDIIATPIGGAALGEVFYRTSDMVLDDRTKGAERFGRELASFIISPMRGFTRIITGRAWKKRAVTGREFDNQPFNAEISLGTRILSYHDNRHINKAGVSARISMVYGDLFETESKTPYDYFSFLAEFNIMKTQPILSRVEIIGRLLSKQLIDNNKYNLSIGLFQHFDFFDSDKISQYKPTVIEPCVVPYKLGTPACIGSGLLFRFLDERVKLVASCHFNGVILGGILSDYYRYYHRNYNWASGFSIKFGIRGSCLNDKLTFAVNNQFYRLYTMNTLGSDVDWSEAPGGKPVNVNGDESIGFFYHMEGQINYRIMKSFFLTAKLDLYDRSTCYKGGLKYDNWYASDWFITSKQISYQIMITKKF